MKHKVAQVSRSHSPNHSPLNVGCKETLALSRFQSRSKPDPDTLVADLSDHSVLSFVKERLRQLISGKTKTRKIAKGKSIYDSDKRFNQNNADHERCINTFSYSDSDEVQEPVSRRSVHRPSRKYAYGDRVNKCYRKWRENKNDSKNFRFSFSSDDSAYSTNDELFEKSKFGRRYRPHRRDSSSSSSSFESGTKMVSFANETKVKVEEATQTNFPLAESEVMKEPEIVLDADNPLLTASSKIDDIMNRLRNREILQRIQQSPNDASTMVSSFPPQNNNEQSNNFNVLTIHCPQHCQRLPDNNARLLTNNCSHRCGKSDVAKTYPTHNCQDFGNYEKYEKAIICSKVQPMEVTSHCVNHCRNMEAQDNNAKCFHSCRASHNETIANCSSKQICNAKSVTSTFLHNCKLHDNDAITRIQADNEEAKEVTINCLNHCQIRQCQNAVNPQNKDKVSLEANCFHNCRAFNNENCETNLTATKCVHNCQKLKFNNGCGAHENLKKENEEVGEENEEEEEEIEDDVTICECSKCQKVGSIVPLAKPFYTPLSSTNELLKAQARAQFNNSTPTKYLHNLHNSQSFFSTSPSDSNFGSFVKPSELDDLVKPLFRTTQRPQVQFSPLFKPHPRYYLGSNMAAGCQTDDFTIRNDVMIVSPIEQ